MFGRHRAWRVANADDPQATHVATGRPGEHMA